MLLLLLIEILGTRVDFHTKSRNPPGQKASGLRKTSTASVGDNVFS